MVLHVHVVYVEEATLHHPAPSLSSCPVPKAFVPSGKLGSSDREVKEYTPAVEPGLEPELQGTDPL